MKKVGGLEKVVIVRGENGAKGGVGYIGKGVEVGKG